MSGDFWRRLRLPWLNRDEIEAEVDDELAFHMEMRTAELVDEGMDPAEARARVERDFGDVDRTRSGYVDRRARAQRRSRAATWLTELIQDLRFGARGLARRPVFSATAILVLALGIGAPTTVFTLVQTIFLERPEHVVEPHRLIRVFRSWAPGEGGGTLQHADYLYYRDNASTLSRLAAYGGEGVASFRFGADEPGQLQKLHVSTNYFDVLGVVPVLGRTFRPEEGFDPGTNAVAVVSHGFWSRALAAEPDVVGRDITVNGISFTVVGVAPEGFGGTSPIESAPDLWTPIAMYGALNRIPTDDTAWWTRHPRFLSRWLDVVGRVADGVPIDAAESNLVSLADQLEHAHKGENESVMVSRQFLYRPSQAETLTTLSSVLLGVVTIVLLIAAANVAVLLLSRATTRYGEIGIRTAIGAGRGRIIRQLVAESVLLGAIGGTIGVGLAFLLSGAAGSFLPLPFETRFVPDTLVLAAAASLTLVTSVLVGLVPALHGTKHDVGSVIKERGPRSGSSRVQGALVVAQVALSLMLVSGAFLFAQSFRTASAEDLGFDDRGVLVTGVNLRGIGYDTERGRIFVREALARIEALPGVVAASTTYRVPFGGDWSTDMPAPEGATPNRPDDIITVGLNTVGPAYFDVMGIDIVAGRPIDERDLADAESVVVVNETLAELMWPGANPIGRVVPREPDEPGLTVVGLARDAIYYDLGEDPWTQAYLSVQQSFNPNVSFLVEADGVASDLAPAVQSVLRGMEPDIAFHQVTTLEAVVDDTLARYEVSAVLVGLFGVIALLLATAGLYGVVTFAVSQRTREIGVRMALGAPRGRVARGVLLSGLRLAGLGVGLGLLGTFVLGRYTQSLLYGTEASDPLPLLGSCLALLAVAALASLVPARRATRVDPIRAMKVE